MNGNPRISKTDLLRLRKCKNWFWLGKHDPKAVEEPQNEVLIEGGIHFESLVQGLFPNGIRINGNTFDALQMTRQVLASGCSTLFQATFEHDDFVAVADILTKDENDKWALYEVKASNDWNEDYLIDVAIQRAILADSGIELEKCFLVYLNSSYVRTESLDVAKLVVIQDVTAQVGAFEKLDVRPLMIEAKEVISSKELPVQDISQLSCLPTGAMACPCRSVSYKDLPEYSVFDLLGLPAKNCRKLVKHGYPELVKVPVERLNLQPAQKQQVELTRAQGNFVDKEGIARELEQIQFPVYFLDYETCNFAVPPLVGFKPFQHFVFQYSLHILPAPGAKIEHAEFLADTCDFQNLNELVESLQKAIHPDGGSVVVWHRSFEESRNAEMGSLIPSSADFFRDLNRRIYDLEEVFKQRFYVDYRFKGRTSIKVVLPVLCPELSYSDLSVQNGGDAMNGWFPMSQGLLSGEDLEKRKTDLLAYCKLDTLAMFRIYEELGKTAFLSTTELV